MSRMADFPEGEVRPAMVADTSTQVKRLGRWRAFPVLQGSMVPAEPDAYARDLATLAYASGSPRKDFNIQNRELTQVIGRHADCGNIPIPKEGI